MTGKAAAFITGGSSGIGLELAKLLAERGHSIALFARDTGRLQDAVQVLKSLGADGLITAYPLDVGDRDAVARTIKAAISDHGAPGWAIANAGIAEPGEFLTQDLDVFEAQMQINYMGALYFAKAVAPAMTAKGGKLVFVGSGAGFFGIYGYSSYAPTKFAMRALAEVLRVELKPQGISVTLVYPPDTDTPMLDYEDRHKPAVTKVITAGGGIWSAHGVANLIVRRAEQGRFAVTPGMQMRALLILHSLIAPLLRAWQGWLVKRHGK